MNAFYTVWCVVLLVLSESSHQMVQESNISEEHVPIVNVTTVNLTLSTTESSIPTTAPPAETTTISPEPVSCVTPKGLAGLCEERKYCDYQTVAIDLTLYAPRSYVKTCVAHRPEQMVLCCPLGYLAPRSDEPQQDAETDFDDDDDF